MSQPAAAYVVDSNNPKHAVTVPALLELVGETTRAKWRAIGDMDSKIHWQYGAEADALISEGYPAMVVYKAIAIEAGKSSQTIRKAYYTFTSFTPAHYANTPQFQFYT